MNLDVFNDAAVSQWITSLGYIGIATVVFAETGLFFCFFLPGDSLLFTAGMLAATGVLSIAVLIPLLIAMAFLGYCVGYGVGFYFGHRLARRPDSWYYKKHYAENAHRFMQKYGKLALLLGRLIAVIRTFVPVVAGMGEMPFLSYTFYNFLGAVIWATSIPLLGYYFGRFIPNMSHYVIVIVAGIVIVSLLPALLEWWRKRS